ncbi:APC amino acid permease [Amanita rubescens]|nr:APC amino acid permease [Amanita rubescens]
MSTTKGDSVQPHGAQDPERQPLIPTPGGTAQKPPDFGSTGTKDCPCRCGFQIQVALDMIPETAGPTTGTPSAGSTRPVPFQKGSNGNHGESFDDVPPELRTLGLFSATTLIFNFVIGTGIYASPGLILQAAGSVGMALILWVAGSFIAAAGTYVYVEYGTSLPRSGGAKNYLEFSFDQPQWLMTCIFAIYSVYLIKQRSSAPSSIIFGNYALRALGIDPTPSNVRSLAYYCLTFVTFVHGLNVTLGIRIQNVLGMFKLVVLAAIAIAGILSLAGVSGFQVRDGYDKPHNYEWKNFWEGTVITPEVLSGGFYNVLWAFVGFQNANYALSEVKNPVLTLKNASVISFSIVATLYVLVNIAYFAVVSKKDMLDSNNVVVAYTNVTDAGLVQLLSSFVALSVLGSVMATQFSQGRVIQEVGREGVLPFSGFLSSNKPFNTPFAGLFTQYLISSTLLFATPPGDGFVFLLSLGIYCIFIVNTLVSIGLLLIHVKGFSMFQWNPTVRTPRFIVIAYFVSNVLLLIAPFIPSSKGRLIYQYLPYWSHAAAAFGVALIGIAYWYWFAVWHPKKWGYSLEKHRVTPPSGVSRHMLLKIPNQDKPADVPAT